mmetsp:Transcript_6215/g.13055  ORF Transcript_6215/g.13055 Transcript_6215/m.13055 type:complete len:80 (+) Transcript_6215:180-419(+)
MKTDANASKTQWTHPKYPCHPHSPTLSHGKEAKSSNQFPALVSQTSSNIKQLQTNSQIIVNVAVVVAVCGPLILHVIGR